MSASDSPSLAFPSFSESSFSSSEEPTPANVHLFQRDDSIVHNPRAYLHATVDASRSLGTNLAHKSALTHLVYSKMNDLQQDEYLTAYVAPLIHGVLHPEFSVEVDLQRSIDTDTPQSTGSGHLAALLRDDPGANLFGVHPEAKQQSSSTSQSFLDVIRNPISSFCSTWLAYKPADNMTIHPTGGDPIQRPPLKAQAIMEFLHPEQDPFSLERLASLFAFYTSDVAPSYNVVEQNSYHMSAWIWHAVARLAPYVRHQLLDLEPMGKCGILRTVDCMRYRERVGDKVLDRARQAWDHWERRYETASQVKWKEIRRQRHISAVSAERVANEQKIKRNWRDLSLPNPRNEQEKLKFVGQVHSQLTSDSAAVWRTIDGVSRDVAPLVLDIIQTELDASTTIDTYRFTCIKCLRALGKRYDLLPESFICRDVERQGSSAIWGGGFADIWQGTMSADRKPVCLKILRLFVTQDRAKMFKAVCHEALVWRQLRHPNVLPFLGVNNDLFAPCFCLISEWMKNGNIMSFLLDHPTHDRFQSIIEITEGVRYLHDLDPQIVHADIRGANVLVSDDYHCVLADFGISLMAETQAPGSTTLLQGTTRWLPPEMIDTALFEKAYLPARDIYSFACTVIEIYTGKPPFSHIRTDIGVVNEVIVHKRIPPRPTFEELPWNELWEVLVRCLAADARDRPTASSLLQSLHDLSGCDDTSSHDASTDHGMHIA